MRISERLDRDAQANRLMAVLEAWCLGDGSMTATAGPTEPVSPPTSHRQRFLDEFHDFLSALTEPRQSPG